MVLILLAAACTSSPAVSAPTQTAPATTVPSSVPTPTASPVPTPTATLKPTPTMPPRPQRFADLPEAILAYLNADPANAAKLEAILSSWNSLGGGKFPTSLARADFDGDGQEDIFLALNPPEPSPSPLGMLVLYLRQGTTFRLAQKIGLLEPTPLAVEGSDVPQPNIVAVGDLLKDGRVQIVYTSTTCGAHTCFITTNVLRWDGTQLRSLMAQPPPVMAYAEVSIRDSGAGPKEIILYGGIIASAGAGPQRARTEIYRWNGKAFALAETKVDSSTYLYFKVVDANALMLNKQYNEAIVFYQEAINNTKLELSGRRDSERADLQAFSRFRAMVAYALLGDFAKAQSARNDLSAKQPNHIYARVAKTFWDAYLPRRSVAAGCNAITTFAQANTAVPAVLQDFGYANLDLKAEDVCPFR